jgi:BRCT domain type II-containing protein
MNTGPLAGQTIVFTGKMKKTRFEMEVDAQRLGAYTLPRVTRRTTILVTGTRPGKTKLNAAQRFGTRMLTEAELEQEVRRRVAAFKAASVDPDPEPERTAVEPAERAPAPEWAKTVRTRRSLGF